MGGGSGSRRTLAASRVLRRMAITPVVLFDGTPQRHLAATDRRGNDESSPPLIGMESLGGRP